MIRKRRSQGEGVCVLTPSSDVTGRAGESMKYGHVRKKGLLGKHFLVIGEDFSGVSAML